MRGIRLTAIERDAVIRHTIDQVGNDLTARLAWCSTHQEPVWVHGDGSFECPHERIVGWASDGGHALTEPPWHPILSLVNGEPCPTCKGTHKVPCDYGTCPDPGRHTGVLHPCPDCTDGTRPGLIERLDDVLASILANHGHLLPDDLDNLAAVIVDLDRAVGDE